PWIPLVLVWVCFGFMWLESVLGVCVGCKLHALLVRLGLFQQACDVCDLPGFGNAAGGKPVVNISPGRS
ncbi:MAG: DUF4395 family protein, partial [Hylemonella sp.]